MTGTLDLAANNAAVRRVVALGVREWDARSAAADAGRLRLPTVVDRLMRPAVDCGVIKIAVTVADTQLCVARDG